MQTKLIFLSSDKVIKMKAWTSNIAWGKLAAMWRVGKVVLTLFQSRSSQMFCHRSDTRTSRTLILFRSRTNLAGAGPLNSRSRISAGSSVNSWPTELCAQCYCLGLLWCEKALEHYLRRATLTEEGAVLPLESSWPCKVVVRWGYPRFTPLKSRPDNRRRYRSCYCEQITAQDSGFQFC